MLSEAKVELLKSSEPCASLHRAVFEPSARPIYCHRWAANDFAEGPARAMWWFQSIFRMNGQSGGAAMDIAMYVSPEQEILNVNRKCCAV